MTVNLQNNQNGPLGFNIDAFAYPQFLTGDRPPTSRDVYTPGTRIMDASVTPRVIYETTGGGVWNITSTALLLATALSAGSVFIATAAQVLNGTAPSGNFVALANDVAAALATVKANAQFLSVKNLILSSSPYTVLTTDQFLPCDTINGSITIVLPNNAQIGRKITIADGTGQTNAQKNITINGNGKNISAGGSSAAVKILSLPYQSINLVYNGTIWNGQLIN